MTLKTIATNILNKNKASEVPTTFAGNSNDTARLVFAAVKDATQFVLWANDWQRLLRTYYFNTVPTQEGYDLPGGIQETNITPYTLWNQTTRFQLNGPISLNQWQLFKNLLLIPTIIQQYILLENQIKIYPIPSSIQALNFIYSTNLCIKSSNGSEQSEWLADDDYSILNEYAIELQGSWMYLKQLQRPYDEAKNLADDYLQKLIQQDGTRQVIGVNMQSLPPTYPLPSYLQPITR